MPSDASTPSARDTEHVIEEHLNPNPIPTYQSHRALRLLVSYTMHHDELGSQRTAQITTGTIQQLARFSETISRLVVRVKIRLTYIVLGAQKTWRAAMGITYPMFF